MMTKDEIYTALDWLDKNHRAAVAAKDFSLAEAIYSKIEPLQKDLIQMKIDEEDQERDWGMEWYDTRSELE